jgi:hypothetical protein
MCLEPSCVIYSSAVVFNCCRCIVVSSCFVSTWSVVANVPSSRSIASVYSGIACCYLYLGTVIFHQRPRSFWSMYRLLRFRISSSVFRWSMLVLSKPGQESSNVWVKFCLLVKYRIVAWRLSSITVSSILWLLFSRVSRQGLGSIVCKCRVFL